MLEKLQDFLNEYQTTGNDDQFKSNVFYDLADYYENVVAIECYKKAADFNNKLALRKLVKYYKTKRGKRDDTREKYLSIACEFGDAVTKKMVTEIYESEQGNPASNDELGVLEETIESHESHVLGKIKTQKEYKEKERTADKLYVGQDVVRDKDKAIKLYKEIFESEYTNKHVCKVLADHYYEKANKALSSNIGEEGIIAEKLLEEALMYYKACYEYDKPKALITKIISCFKLALDNFGILINANNKCSLLGQDERDIVKYCIDARNMEIKKGEIVFKAITTVQEYYEKLTYMEKKKEKLDEAFDLIYTKGLLYDKVVYEVATGRDGKISYYDDRIISIIIDGKKMENIYPDIFTKSKLFAFKDREIQDKVSSYEILKVEIDKAQKDLKNKEIQYRKVNIKS